VSVAFDTATRLTIDHENKDHARRNLDARLMWACEDPSEIERWKIGLRLVESRTLADVPERLRLRLSWPMRAAFRVFAKLFPTLTKAYQLALFAGQSEA
jgi:O-methyltransferase involved in polyketide biosynthesis